MNDEMIEYTKTLTEEKVKDLFLTVMAIGGEQLDKEDKEGVLELLQGAVKNYTYTLQLVKEKIVLPTSKEDIH